jgi:hypothetical protein
MAKKQSDSRSSHPKHSQVYEGIEASLPQRGALQPNNSLTSFRRVGVAMRRSLTLFSNK